MIVLEVLLVSQIIVLLWRSRRSVRFGVVGVVVSLGVEGVVIPRVTDVRTVVFVGFIMSVGIGQPGHRVLWSLALLW